MTNSTLEAMAREAGMVPLLTPAWDLSEADQDWRVCTADLTRFAALVRARALEEAGVMEMALCEVHRVVLRVGQPYVFRPIGDCETCAKMAQDAMEAYGPEMGAAAIRSLASEG